jgi:glycosyltransferase involved in cell wall biosynthesis
MKIKLVLATRNRPNYALLALESILNQTYQNFDILISDNSTNEDFKNIYYKKYNGISNLKYIFRGNDLAGIEHFNQLIEECQNCDFIMFFHDDDILENNYMQEIINSGKIYDNNISAIAVNAKIMYNDNKTKKLIFNSINDIIINTKLDLINHYFNIEYPGAAPFPGYIYRSKFLTGMTMKNGIAGKHNDLIFLLQLLDKGKFYWINKPLMNYRIHKNNDSNTISIDDRNGLFNYLNNYNLITKNTLLDFKMMFNKELYKNKKINIITYIDTIIKYILTNLFYNRLYIICKIYLKKLKLSRIKI